MKIDEKISLSCLLPRKPPAAPARAPRCSERRDRIIHDIERRTRSNLLSALGRRTFKGIVCGRTAIDRHRGKQESTRKETRGRERERGKQWIQSRTSGGEVHLFGKEHDGTTHSETQRSTAKRDKEREKRGNYSHRGGRELGLTPGRLALDRLRVSTSQDLPCRCSPQPRRFLPPRPRPPTIPSRCLPSWHHDQEKARPVHCSCSSWVRADRRSPPLRPPPPTQASSPKVHSPRSATIACEGSAKSVSIPLDSARAKARAFVEQQEEQQEEEAADRVRGTRAQTMLRTTTTRSSPRPEEVVSQS